MNGKIEVGTKLVEKGKVFTVYKVEEVEEDGKLRRIIHYKPYYENETDNCLICSIPEDSLSNANLRLPLSKKEMTEIFEFISSKNTSKSADTNDAKNVLNLNDPVKTAEVIVTFWTEKEEQGDGFSSSKRHVLELAIKRIIEEFALVNKITPKTAHKRVSSALEVRE